MSRFKTISDISARLVWQLMSCVLSIVVASRRGSPRSKGRDRPK